MRRRVNSTVPLPLFGPAMKYLPFLGVTPRVMTAGAAVTVRILFLPILFCTLGCDAKARPTITFILPEDYRGVFLVGDPSDEADVQQGLQLHVPESGILFIRDRSIFESYHHLKARACDGSDLHVAGDGAGQADDALHELGATERWHVFFYGPSRQVPTITSDLGTAVAEKLQNSNLSERATSPRSRTSASIQWSDSANSFRSAIRPEVADSGTAPAPLFSA